MWNKDGMDQAKFCIPRCRAGVTTKSMAKYERPRVKIQGVWLHQALLSLHVVDVRQSGDASMVIECLSKDLEKMAEVCKEQGKKTPKRLLLWVPLSEHLAQSCFDRKVLIHRDVNIVKYSQT